MATESDEALCLRVDDALASDPRTRDTLVEVSTLRGKVTVAGKVDTLATKEAVEQVVGSVVEVQGVNSELYLPEHTRFADQEW